MNDELKFMAKYDKFSEKLSDKYGHKGHTHNAIIFLAYIQQENNKVTK